MPRERTASTFHFSECEVNVMWAFHENMQSACWLLWTRFGKVHDSFVTRGVKPKSVGKVSGFVKKDVGQVSEMCRKQAEKCRECVGMPVSSTRRLSPCARGLKWNRPTRLYSWGGIRCAMAGSRLKLKNLLGLPSSLPKGRHSFHAAIWQSE